MIARSYIQANLARLDRMYRRTSSDKEALFYSKLAVLELCGWIEESMDDLILRCCNRHIKSVGNRKFVESDIVKRTYGFDYEKHFRRMLIQLLGLINVERLEREVDPTLKAGLQAALANLKVARDGEAHTHIKGVARQINAPSLTLSQFCPVYDGLMEYQRVLRSTRW